MNDDDELLDRLGRSIEPTLPPVDPDRLAAVRAQAQAQAQVEGTPTGPTLLGSEPADGAPARPSRRSVLRLGAAAAGGIAAGAAGVFLLTDGDDDEPPGPPLEAATVRAVPGVVASADLIDHTWGLEVILDVDGLEPGAAYEMTFVSTDGRRVGAGGFVGTGEPMVCRNNGPLLRADTTRFVVTGPEGDETLSADLA